MGISTGSVSAIIESFRKEDPQFDLLRAVAVKLKSQNMDVRDFAPLVRLRGVLKDKGLLTGTTGSESLELVQDRMEGLLIGLDVFCFKRGLSIEDFVSLVTNMYNVSENLGVRLAKFPAYIAELKSMY